jgi:phosphatidate cytidylyltransferase
MKTRIITGIILLLIGVLVLTLGGWWMWGWVSLTAVLSLYEMFKMIGGSVHFTEVMGYGTVLASMASTRLPELSCFWHSSFCRLAVLSLFLMCMLELILGKVWISKSEIKAKWRMTFFVALFFPFIYLLREGHLGLLHFLFVFGVVWTCDIAALFGGRILGRTPLLKRVSPKKTVEGSFIGLFAGLIFASILIYIYHLAWVPYLLLALFVGIFSQVGDLHESLIKRHYQVKDSSSLLPGHGGFYDRADSALFVCPISVILFSLTA